MVSVESDGAGRSHFGPDLTPTWNRPRFRRAIQRLLLMRRRNYICEDRLTMQPPDPVRRNKETRKLKGLIGMLALTTAALGLLLYPVLGFATLLAPFVLFVFSCGLVLPLDGHDLHRGKTVAQVQAERRKKAELHAMPLPTSVTEHARTNGSSDTARKAATEALLCQQQAMRDAETQGIHFGSAHLADDEFLRAFSAGELRAQGFRHGDHLRFAWLTLERLPLGMAEESIAQALRGFLRRISGSTAPFHATHTHGWFAVLASLPQRTFAEALAQNTAALQSSALTRYWSQPLLDSPEARAAAPPPDVAALPLPIARRTRRYRQGNTSLPPAPYAPVLHRANE